MVPGMQARYVRKGAQALGPRVASSYLEVQSVTGNLGNLAPRPRYLGVGIYGLQVQAATGNYWIRTGSFRNLGLGT